MRRKKQFAALSLAAVLALGGVFSSSEPISKVHAEGMQTEESAEQLDANGTEQPTEAEPTVDATEQPTEAEPTVDATEQPAEGQPAVGTTEQPVEGEPVVGTTEQPAEGELTVETTGQPTEGEPAVGATEQPVEGEPTVGATEQPAEGQPITDGTNGSSTEGAIIDPDGIAVNEGDTGNNAGNSDNSYGVSVFADSNAEKVENALDFASMVEKDADGTVVKVPKGVYGDDVVAIELMSDVSSGNYSPTNSKEFTDEANNKHPYVGSIKYSAGSVTLSEGVVTEAKNAIKIKSSKDAVITVAIYKTANTIHLQYVENGELKDTAEAGTDLAVSGNVLRSFPIQADTEYYFYGEGGSIQLGHIGYVYTKEAEPGGDTAEMKPLEDLLNWFAKEKDSTPTEALPVGVVYGNDAIEVEFIAEEGKVIVAPEEKERKIDGIVYYYGAKINANGSVVVQENAVNAKNAIKVTAKKNGTISFVMYKSGNEGESKFLHFQSVEESGLKEYDGYGVLVTDHKTHTFDLEAGKTYYLWIENGKATVYNMACTVKEDPKPGIDLPRVDAFPGAEGGGRYATGGRGGDVYVVTNLNDKGEGSLRYGVESAPDAGRIIVFDVGGTIHLNSTLSFKNKKNITIAGQTAPGEGITIAGYDTNISDSENIVIRFVHFRVGTDNLLSGGDSMDALWGRDNDTFIIDHCSFSWNTDETLSTYRGQNGTVQWCIISESLTVSGHSKGRHGYGGIWGGNNTVFQYNLLANHTSRNPRIGGGSMNDPIAAPEGQKSYATLQLNNNVLYNQGYYPCYGGGYTYTNYINNYIKPGVGTRESIRNVLLNVGEKGKDGGFYVDGNYLYGNEEITANNLLGIRQDADGYLTATEPYKPVGDDGLYGKEYGTKGSSKYTNEQAFDVTEMTAEECYEPVLNNAGVTFPHRDAIDARVVAQVRDDTGSYVNTPDEVGGYCAPEVSREDGFDSDGDGIPDAWEEAHGLNKDSAPDDFDSIKVIDDKDDPNYGYSWIEVYFNELVEDVVDVNYAAPNPEVAIDLADNRQVNEGESVTVTATAAAKNGGDIARVEFYNGDELVETVTSAPYSYTYTGLADGTYHISVRAYDNEGNATQSDTSRLHVNSAADTGDWLSTDVGQPGVPGTASLTDGVLTVKGAGKLGKSENSVSGSELSDATTDDFSFVYQEMTGDMELVAKLDSYTVVDCHTFNGLMFRESLDANAATVAMGLTMTKIWDGYERIWTAFMVKRDVTGGNMSNISETIDGKAAAEKAGIPAVTDLNFKSGNTFNGTWLKLTRKGDVFTGAVSDDGLVWQTVGELTVDLPETVYVGFAVDAGKAANQIENYATAKFSDIVIHKEFGTITYDIENVEYSGTDQFALGDDISIVLTNIKGYLLPETVEVTVGGKAVDVDYDRENGIISLKNLTGDVVVKAKGVKRPVLPVEYEEVDPEDLLTVEEKDGKLILTQIAASGSTSSGFPGDSKYKDAVNESWILFPEVNQAHEMSLKITITGVTGTGNNAGVYVGAFDITQGQQAFNSLGFRSPEVNQSLSRYWTKKDKTGNGGSYKLKTELSKEYEVIFSYDDNGQITEKWKIEGEDEWKKVDTFKFSESYLQKGARVRYGIGLIGATAEITGLKLVDHEGNVIYYQDSADYSAVTAAIEHASSLNPEDYVDFSDVLAAWDAVELGLAIDKQAQVDAMAKAIEDAIAALVEKPNLADYTAVDAAIAKAEALNGEEYENFASVTAAIEAVERGLTDQAQVDAMAKAIEDAIAALVKKPNLADYTAVDAAIAKAEALNGEEYENFASVTAAIEAVERGLTDQAKVDAMAKAIEDAIAALVKKEIKIEEIKAEPTETIPDKVLQDVIQAGVGCTTVEELIEFMSGQVVKGEYADASSIVWDVTIMITYSVNGVVQDPVPATKDNMPKGGVDIVLPYPEGTNKEDYEFVVSHLITQDWNNQVPGTVEWPDVTKTDDGLKIRVMSASPFSVAWKQIVKENPNDPDDDDNDDVEEVGENTVATPAKTGDNMNVFAVICGVILLAAVAGIGVLVYFRKRRME